MIPKAFEYLAPKTLPEAISLLQQHGNTARILAGGHSLIPLMKLRQTTPDYVIDINKISGLDYIKESDGYLRIGALTREAALEESELIRSKYPIILDTARVLGDQQVRNMATVVGNIAQSDPGYDLPATMLALNAQVAVTGAQGERIIPIDELFIDYLKTALQPDEIITEISIPIPPAGSGGAYVKLESRVGGTVGVAASVTLDEDKVCQTAGIGLTNVALTPLKAKKAEELLIGKILDEGIILQAAQLAAEESKPTSDIRAPEEYKRAIVKELARRSLTFALGRTQAGK